MMWEVVLWCDSEPLFYSEPLTWSECESVYFEQCCYMESMSGDFICSHEIEFCLRPVPEVDNL